MVNKENNSKVIEAEIKKTAFQMGISADTLKRIATLNYIKNKFVDVSDSKPETSTSHPFTNDPTRK